jgi:phosphoserine phosphatase RsbU/P
MFDQLISRLDLFATLPPAELSYLASTLQVCEVSDHTVVFHEGQHDGHCYILVEGQVEIVKAMGTPAERSLGERGPVSFIGEMSFFNENERHTASVRARTPLQLLCMTRADFDGLLQRQPKLVYELVRTISTRLNESENQTVRDLQDKNRELTEAYEQLQEAHRQIVEKEKLEHELKVGRQIQRSILPAALPRVHGLDLGALMVPSYMVSGDLYDFIPLHGNRLGILIGDVSDKGVPAAIFMALTYSLVRAEAARSTDPGEVLQAVNRLLMHMNSEGMFVTVLYGILDIDTGQLRYARAGHELPLVIDQNGQEIKPQYGHGQPLGLFHDPVLDVQSMVLPAGSMLLFFTDGITEASTPQGEYFGLDGLKKVIHAQRAQGRTNAQELCQAACDTVKALGGDGLQQDDITIIAVRLE